MKGWIKVFLCLSFLSQLPLRAEILEGIVAVVDDEVITRHDLEEYLAPVYFQCQSQYQGEELQTKLKQLQKEGLRQLIEEKLLLSEARKRKITAEEKEIQQRMQQVKLKFPSEEEFYKTLSEQNITE